MSNNRWMFLFRTLTAILAVAPLEQLPAQNVTGSTPILDSAGFWRAHFTFRTPVMRKGEGLVKLPTVTGDTALPPSDWARPDFDDREWPRMPGFLFPAGGYNRPVEWRNAGYTEYEPTTPNLALICMRGKFEVTDPSAVRDLKLSVAFRGGLVAYLNGKEVARAGLSDGKTGLEALADDYPLDASLKADGTILGGPYLGAKTDDPETLRRWRLRVRECAVTIPAEDLRKGVNVLALEIHRAAYPAEMMDTTRKVELHLIASCVWATCNLLTTRLEGTGTGVVPNVSRPKGVQVWNSQPINPDYDVDFGDPTEAVLPLRLAGTRGGVVSGKVVLGSDQPIRGLTAACGDFTAQGGKIPASAVKVRYAIANGWDAAPPGAYTVQPTLFDGLSDAPPVEVAMPKKDPLEWYLLPGQIKTVPGAVVPVWVTVAVPGDAPAGDYKATLSLRVATGQSWQVPVELSVSPWRAPAPADFKTVVDLIQSPESVALQYGVEPYSDEHFKYLAASFDRMGYLGNWSVYLPLIGQCNLGNEQTLVRWIKEVRPAGEPGASYKHDFTVFEKYLDSVTQHVGKPKIVILYVWDLFIGGVKTGHQDEKIGGVALAASGIPVTQLDPATGRISTLMLPGYGDATRADWKAVADGVMERLRKRGLDKVTVIGIASDGRPSKEIVTFLSGVFSGVPWAHEAHMEWKEMGTSGIPLGYQANVYPYKIVEEPAAGKFSCYGWNRPDLRTMYLRTYEANIAPVMARLFPEMTVLGYQRGFGRVGLDFWPVLKNPKGGTGGILHGRYPQSNWSQLDAMIQAFVPPGPDGAMSSAHLEMMREGIQESEARIAIERVLLDKGLRARLGEERATRCQQVLDERARSFLPDLGHQCDAGFSSRYDPLPILNGYDNYAYNGLRSILFYRWYQHSGWQARTKRLFDLAAEVEGVVR